MKIKAVDSSYEAVARISVPKRKKPCRQSPFFRALVNIVTAGDLKKVNFTYTKKGMDAIDRKQPCLFLMNHSCFLDLEMAFKIISPKPFHIICTSDGFVGKEGLMRMLGCIPTSKFCTDVGLVRDMLYVTKTLKSSILMYPEASYTFDGTATPLPTSLGKMIKMMGVPVVMIKTEGAFLRDPLYNNLQLRKVNVSASEEYVLSPESAAKMSVQEINSLLKDLFTFDGFSYQRENHIKITEPFRADHLDRVLYKCPHCGSEREMTGKGITVTCGACGTVYELTEEGALSCKTSEGKFTDVPEWYRWERDCVRNEISSGSYKMDMDVNIVIMKDMKAVYRVGTGHLTHNRDGFTLVGCGGKLRYTQRPLASYSLYSDYYWYEIGDMVCIGDGTTLYYCFPIGGEKNVAKARLAAEELYKMCSERARV